MKSLLFAALLPLFCCSGAQVKLMFGGSKTPPAARQFLDFQFVGDNDRRFQDKEKKFPTKGWFYQSNAPRHAWAAVLGPSKGSLPPDEMTGHSVLVYNSQLTLDLPNGQYKIHLFLGDWYHGIFRFCTQRPHSSLAINGKTVLDVKWTPESTRREWLRTEEYNFQVKDPIWDRLVKPVLTEKEYDCTVTGGKLHLDMQNILLNALVVAPESEMPGILKNIEAARRKEFASRYPWKPKKNEPMPKVDPRSKSRGFLLFQASGEDKIYPWSRPKQSELTESPRIFAAQGEQEMIRFGIIPLRNLEKLTVRIGDFRNGNVTLKTAENSDFFRERYREYGSQEQSGAIDAVWRLDPRSMVMTAPEPVDCETGTPRIYTLDFRVPANAVPGNYTAPVEFFENGRKVGYAKLMLKVLPFRLEREDAAQFGFQSAAQYSGLASDSVKGYSAEQYKERMMKYWAFNRKYGFSFNHQTFRHGIFNLMSIGHIEGKPGQRRWVQTPQERANGDWYLKFLRSSCNTKFIDIQLLPYFLRAGGWDPGPGAINGLSFGKKGDSKEVLAQKRRDIIQIMKDFQRFADSNKKEYPEVYWYVSGEADKFGMPGVQLGVEMAKVVHEMGGKAYAVINGKLGAKLFPPCYEFILANHSTPLNDDLVAEVRKYGHTYGSHNTGQSRFAAGWHFWRTGAFHKYQETIFYVDFCRPYALLPWNYQTALALPAPEPEGVLRPTIMLLNYRDGMEDYLYLHTLENVIKRAKANGHSKECAAAEAFLRKMHDSIQMDMRKYHIAKVSADEGSGEVNDDEWNSFSFDRLRWQIALYIMDLQKFTK